MKYESPEMEVTKLEQMEVITLVSGGSESQDNSSEGSGTGGEW